MPKPLRMLLAAIMASNTLSEKIGQLPCFLSLLSSFNYHLKGLLFPGFQFQQENFFYVLQKITSMEKEMLYLLPLKRKKKKNIISNKLTKNNNASQLCSCSVACKSKITLWVTK